MKMTLVGQAIRMAVEAHNGATDRTGQPYILHPLRVGAMGLTFETQVCGFLHDTVEDTDVTLEVVRANFGLTIADAIDALTKRKGEPYMGYVVRAGQNRIALYVKLNDLYDNTRDARMCLLHDKTRSRLIPKYNDAIKYLEGLL